MKLIDGSKFCFTFVVSVFMGFTCFSPVLADFSFQGLGDLPGGIYSSRAHAVSADGSVVVGYSLSSSGYEAFRWTSGTGIVGLGDLEGGWFHSMANGISADGSVIVGGGVSDSGDSEAFRWTAATGMQGLGDLPEGAGHSGATAASADGSVVVGFGHSGLSFEAFRWVDLNSNGIVDPAEKLDLHPEFGLGFLPDGGFNTKAYHVSADGSIVVGESIDAHEAFHWTAATGMVGLGDLPGGTFASRATAVSDDGSVVVGSSTSDFGPNEGFRWVDLNNNGQLDPDEKLDFHPEFGLDLGEVTALSGDGSVLGGGFGTGNIWDQTNGVRNLWDVLDQGGLDMTGWTLGYVSSISADGMTFVGWGTNPDGYEEAWVATVPTPGAVLLCGMGLGLTGWLCRRKTH